MYFLAICNECGLGTERNEAKAAELYRDAASRGQVNAQHNLAVFFEHGLGGTVCRMSHVLSVPWTLCLFYYTWLPSLSTALEVQCVVCPMR